MGYPVPDHLVEPQRAGDSVDQGQHVRAERVLQLGVLVQVVQDDLGDRIPLQHDDEPLAGTAAGLVAHIRDAGNPAVAHQLGDLQRQVVRIDLVGELGGHQAGTALAVLLHLDHRTHGDRPAPGAVGIVDPSAADDLRPGREVGALNPLDQRLEQLVVRGIVVIQEPLDAGGELPQVMRRDLGRHPDRDALGAVDKKVREPAGQYHRLPGAPVVVRPEVDGVLVDVPQHFHGQRREPALGVAVRSSRVVARRAEVALGVHERHPHRPRLGQPDQRVVNGGVAVRVIVTHHLADDPGALEIAPVGAVAAVIHRVQDAGVHGLQSVPHIRQRTADDDRHRVLDVAALHLDLDVDRLGAVTACRGTRVQLSH